MMFFELITLDPHEHEAVFFCFLGQFCDVAEVAIIGKPILANLGY